MKKIAGLALIGYVLLNSFQASAQTYSESALLFSRIRPGGSARIQAMGGSQVSLGGDYSSAISNPAGLGMYNRSEFTITPAVFAASSTSNYMGNSTPTSKSTFEVPGLSLVLHSDQNKGSFISGSFAVSFNRLNDFNKSFSYSGTNSKNSIIDYFIKDATGLNPSSLLSGGDYYNNPTSLAYSNYLIEDSTFINPNASPTDYMSVMGTYPGNPNDVRTVFQKEDVTTSGAQNQWSFSYGANFSDKIFIGAGLGITSLHYTSKKVYRESNYNFVLDPTYNPLDNIELIENLKTSGTGINASLGIIARPVDFIQLGLSYNSPTAYTLSDSYSATMTSDWNNFDYNGDGSLILGKEGDQTDVVISDYSLRTPSRLNLGTTVFIAKKGFLTGDVEFVNYGGAKYSATTGSSGQSFDHDNDQIKSYYQSTVNYRLGGEFRIAQNFRFRLGYSYMQDPYRTMQNDVNTSISSGSLGLGYRIKTFFVDLAYISTAGNNSYRPYTVNSIDSPVVGLKNKTNTVMVTLGFPFY